MRREKMKKIGWIIIMLFLMAILSWSVAIAKDNDKCEDGWEKSGALCYPDCKPGYKGVGPVCWEKCPSGYKDDGAFCRKPGKIISADNKDCPWYDKCGVGAYYWKHKKRCSKCPDGYKNDGCTCRIKVIIDAKKSYGRGAGKPLLGLGQEAKTCYERKDDQDGDGYAREDAKKIRARQWANKVNCPDGYVNKAGDKNDNDKLIHPRRDEVPLNNKDDNCNGKKDEPTFVYSTNPTRKDGFDMKVRINDSNTVRYKNNLYADLTIHSLRDTGTPIDFDPADKLNIIEDGKITYAIISVKNLSPATVYRVKVQLHYKDGNEYKPVGVESGDYFTTTWSDDRVERARSVILLRGFKEYGESKLGRVGYRGTDKVDGTKYGADKNEHWCSEFYSWVTQENLKDIKGKTYVNQLINYFQHHKSTYDRNHIKDRAKRGDYIAVSTEGDGKKDHSAMFLAYDQFQKTIWTLEGNIGNEVVISDDRVAEGEGAANIAKLGGIVSSMVK
jgi:hypothetical protein